MHLRNQTLTHLNRCSSLSQLHLTAIPRPVEKHIAEGLGAEYVIEAVGLAVEQWVVHGDGMRGLHADGPLFWRFVGPADGADEGFVGAVGEAFVQHKAVVGGDFKPKQLLLPAGVWAWVEAVVDFVATDDAVFGYSDWACEPQQKDWRANE